MTPGLRSIVLLTSLAAAAARAEFAVAATDNKLILVDGARRVLASHAPDTFDLIDLSARPPRLVAEIPVPTSVIGPPLSLAVAPDEKLALDTSCMKVDPQDPTKQTADDRLSVIDLTTNPPRVIATLQTGLGPAGVAINRQGTLALVANRAEGSVSIFALAGPVVTPQGKLVIGNAASALASVAFTPDGKQALVSRDGDDLVTFLAVDGSRVTRTGRDLRTGLHPGARPYGLDITRDGRTAVVANDGEGTISVIDLRGEPRVAQTLRVGPTPEGIKLSPDGTLCAVIVENNSDKAKAAPAFNDFGLLEIFRVADGRLTPAGEAHIGHWSQGVAFSTDNRVLLVCNMVEKNLQVFAWDGATLRDTGQPLVLGGGPVAVRTADR